MQPFRDIVEKVHFVPRFDHFLPHISRTRFLPDMQFSQKDAHYWPLLSCRISKKTNEDFSRKSRKTPFWPRFDPFLPQISTPWFFFEKRALSLFLHYCDLTSCKKSKKTNEPFSVTWKVDGPTDGRTKWTVSSTEVENSPIFLHQFSWSVICKHRIEPINKYVLYELSSQHAEKVISLSG